MNHHTPLTHPHPTLNTASTRQADLTALMQTWEQDYAKQVSCYPLFQPAITAQWDTATQKRFVRYFYHIRGHFFKFLWELGNEADDPAAKQKVLDNIAEEFGGAGMSHEQLYYVFAEAVGVTDLKEAEWLNETHHCATIKAYNKKHLTWLNAHNSGAKWAAFAAYVTKNWIILIMSISTSLLKVLAWKGEPWPFLKYTNKPITLIDCMTIYNRSGSSSRTLYAMPFILSDNIKLTCGNGYRVSYAPRNLSDAYCTIDDTD